jgi:hypothetical protein
VKYNLLLHLRSELDEVNSHLALQSSPVLLLKPIEIILDISHQICLVERKVCGSEPLWKRIVHQLGRQMVAHNNLAISPEGQCLSALRLVEGAGSVAGGYVFPALHGHKPSYHRAKEPAGRSSTYSEHVPKEPQLISASNASMSTGRKGDGIYKTGDSNQSLEVSGIPLPLKAMCSDLTYLDQPSTGGASQATPRTGFRSRNRQHT